MFAQPLSRQATLASVQVGRKTIKRLMLAAAAASSLVACGEGHPESTLHQDMEKLAGKSLTSSEVVQYTETAEMMCGFDRELLEEIWMRLDAAQLERQDYLFPLHCPERLDLLIDIRPRTGAVHPDLIKPREPESPAPTIPNGETPGSTVTSTPSGFPR